MMGIFSLCSHSVNLSPSSMPDNNYIYSREYEILPDAEQPDSPIAPSWEGWAVCILNSDSAITSCRNSAI